MFNLIEKISEGTRVIVCGESHIAKTKTLYVTEGELNNWYAKIVFEDHSILVIAPYDDFMYYGRIENVFGDGSNFPNTLSYNEKTFEKAAEDYQIVKELVFGNPLIAEGEVMYADYSSEDDEEVLISLAVVSRTNKRADVVANIITLENVDLEG